MDKNENKEKEDLIKDEQPTNENVEDQQQESTEECGNISDMNSKLEEKKLNDQIEELEDKYKRLQAEYANYRRRTQQEKDSLSVFANEKIMKELLPVVDSFERALELCEDKESSMYEGIDLVYKQMIDVLTKLGLEKIEALNKDFDPNYHLAVMQEEVDGVESNKVVTELQKGYKLGNKVLRASMVKVSS